MLAWTIYISFLGVAAQMLLPAKAVRASRALALLTAAGSLAATLAGWAHHPGGELATIVRVPWIPSLGIEYQLATDGISITLLLLTGLVALAGVLFS